MNLEANKRFVIEQFGDDYCENGYELLYHCPFCKEMGDRHNDRKLYANYKSLKWHCFRCGTKGVLNYELSSEFDSPDAIKDILNYFNKSNDEDEESSYYSIPKNRLVDYPGSMPYDYLIGRGITPEMMDKYEMRIPELGSFLHGRIIIPNEIISKNWTDFYVARDYVGNPCRYKNPKSAKKSELIFNYHRIPDNIDYIILNEGALNSIVAGDHSIATFGKSVSDCQLRMIINKHPKKIYVSLDEDARELAISLCQRFVSMSESEIYLVELPDNKDAVDLGRDNYMNIVLSTSRFYSKSIYNITNYFS